MRPITIIALLFPLWLHAQFAGGNGRGDTHLPFLTPVPSRFSGGDGRGDALLAYAAPIPSRFGGGIGRGDAQLAFSGLSYSRFAGGNGRGDVQLAFLYSAPSRFSGGIGRGDVQLAFGPSDALLALRAVLEGPYSVTTGLMGDAMRVSGLVPVAEPYSTLGYAQPGIAGAACAPSVLTTTGTNAIVDWVVVELRDATTSSTVLASRAALIQRDGDIVATDGLSPLTFNRPPGNYNVALRHRNHLGVMTQAAIPLGLSTTPYDLASSGTATYGTNARKSLTGTFPAQALWAGDVTFNGDVKYTGGANDRDPILTTVGSTTPNNPVSLYSTRDVNLDGSVRYTGSGNDRDPILVNVGSTTPNNIRTQQLP